MFSILDIQDSCFFEDNMSRDRTQTLEERIAILSSNLERSSQAISEIEAEIAQRHQLVVQLEQQRQTTENLLRLNREEVESVAQLIRGEVRANERQSFWVNVGTSAFFFVLGLTSPSISRAVTRRLRKEKQG
jgi:septal ring factor EnvC (AmiA/AmiB activator)